MFGVIVVATVAFFVVSPIARNAQRAQLTNQERGQAQESVAPENTTSTTTDVLPVSDTPKTVTLAEIAQHADSTSCWTTIDGNVYDLTPFILQHPGGAANIMRICGIDGTAAFAAQHGSGNRQQQAILENLLIGTLSN